MKINCVNCNNLDSDSDITNSRFECLNTPAKSITNPCEQFCSNFTPYIRGN